MEEGLYGNPNTRKKLISKAPEGFFSLDPFSRHYYSPLNPVFGHELELLGDHPPCPHYLLRDGREDLEGFFLRQKAPRRNLRKSLFLVHYGLRHLVPKPWRPYMGYYEVRWRRRPKRHLGPRNS